MTTLKDFKKLYKLAIDNDQNVFECEGLLLDVGYAKYLIEYLETVKKIPDDMNLNRDWNGFYAG